MGCDKVPFNINGYLGSQIDVLRTEYYKEFSEYFDFAFNVNALSKNLINQIEIHTDNGQELLVSALLVKISNSFQSSILLISNGLDSDAKSILRTQLEALFKLVIIADDSSCAIKFSNTYMYDKKKLLNVIINDNGIIFDKEKFNINELCIKADELDKLMKKADILDTRAEELAKKANLEGYYNLVYRRLCDDVHTNMNSLDKYFINDEMNQISALSVIPYIKDTKMIIITGVILMLRALESCCTLFGVNKDDELKIMVNRIKEFDKDALNDIKET